ncbi:hypothetical protein CRE_26491 [Caenorhabditis remanei]|uniref:Uncharacterized protein n=1 Tax=Caenorhabditis remanei TaxID=31234 RepID=E3LQU3_CAERE|nr:hypothetical protein CRE_26491 [Caenorhabditis remanei]
MMILKDLNIYAAQRLLILLLVPVRIDALISRISTDCDIEFAESATKLASEHITDPAIVQYIHAVMSSCNKAPIQKMAETSVFLLEKGTITPRVMHQIRETYDKIQKKKEGELSKKMSQLPPELYSTAQKIKTISTSGGLSGNERVQQIEMALGALPSSYQRQILEILQESPPKLDGATFEQPEKPIDVTSLPPSFAIPKNTELTENKPRFMIPERQESREEERHFEQKISFPEDPVMVPRVNMPFQPQEKRIQIHPQSISGNQQNMLFPDLPPTRPVSSHCSFKFKKNRFQIEPTIRNQAAGLRSLLENPNFDSIISSIVQKGAKIAEGPLPRTVGAVDHTKTGQNELGILNPAMWSDAAKFLSRSTNDLPTALSKFIENGSQNLPQVLIPSGNQIRQSPTIKNYQNFLPSRRQNDGALDKYDTHIDRFATNGPTNPINIQGDLSSLRLPPVGTTNTGNTAIQPAKVDSIVGAMPTMPPSAGYGTYAPAPSAIIPKVVERILSPEEITGSYRQQQIRPIYNERLYNGQLRNVKIDLVNEQRL